MRAETAIAMAVEEARQLTLDQGRHGYCPYSVASLLQQKGSQVANTAKTDKI